MNENTNTRLEIVKKISLLDYLLNLGFKPARSYGNKHVFSCPVHHGDRTPSFYVYSKEDGRQDCFCFGCKFYGDVIALKSRLENKRVSDVVSEFASQCGISSDDPYAIIDECLSLLSEREVNANPLQAVQIKFVELTSLYRAQRIMGILDSSWDATWRRCDEAIRNNDLDLMYHVA